MDATYKCPNIGNCDIADLGNIMFIAKGEPAVCPDCGADLMPAKAAKSGGSAPTRAAPVRTAPARRTTPATSAPSSSNLTGLVVIVGIMLLVGVAGWLFLRDKNPAPQTASAPAVSVESAVPQPVTVSAPPPVRQAAAILLRFHGSDTIGGKLLPALAAAFLQQEGYAGVRRENGVRQDEIFIVGQRDGQARQIEIESHGSSTAFEDLKSGLCDIGMSSRKVKPEEQRSLLPRLGDLGANASEHVVALDGVALVVHPSNPIRTLSMAQVADIFSGTLTDWSQVGGRAGPVAVYARDDQSGTYDFFKEDVLAPRRKTLAASAQRFEDGKKLSAAVAADPAGIGFIGLNYVGANKVVALSDTGVEARKPSLLTIKTEDYRLSRRLYLYTAENPSNPEVSKFIEFAVGADGQRVVDSTGLVNLDPTPVAPELGNDDARGQSARWRGLTNSAAEMATHIHFRAGSDDLDARANRDIGRISGVLSQPQYQNKKVTLIGLADSSGSRPVNCKLSQDRAGRVKQALAEEGLAFDQVLGLCDDAPIAPNDTPENRERNRRVEVWVK